MPYTYSTDALVKPPVLFGRRLLPLSLGHVRLLHALEHPALSADALELPDIGSAVWICSTPWKKAQRKIRTGKYLNEIRKIGRKAGRMPALQASAFDEYRNFYIEAPPRLQDGQAESARVPWFLLLFCAVQKNTNLSAEETWNLSPRHAAEICAGLSVLNGDKSVMSEAEQELEERITAEPE